jgi:N-acetylneuraminic acid mutarotase
MNKHPEFDFHKPFLLSLLIIILVVLSFSFFPKHNGTQPENNIAGAGGSINQPQAKTAFLLGGQNATTSLYMNNVLTSALGTSWTQIQANASWAKRFALNSLFLKNKIWAMAGVTSSGVQNDVWSSLDGVTWSQVTPHAPWSARSNATALTFDNKLWILGGTPRNATYNYFSDVWSSPDGLTWTQITATAPWGKRAFHASTVFNNKMWVIGGFVGTPPTSHLVSDVWSSPDGISWTQTTPNAGWMAYSKEKVLVFDNKMWVFIPNGQIWSSPDGVTWAQTTVSGASTFLKRADSDVFVLNNKMWIVGGTATAPGACTGPNGFCNDAWSSLDGMTWAQETTAVTSYAGVAGHSIVLVPPTFGSNPDLIITALSFDPTTTHQSTTNSQVRLSFVIRNNSAVQATLPTGTKFVFSYDPGSGVYAPVADVTLATSIALPAQGILSFTADTYTTVPLRATVSSYKVKIIADTTGMVTETNETNNELQGTLRITP